MDILVSESREEIKVSPTVYKCMYKRNAGSTLT